MRTNLWLNSLERRELPAVLSVTSILDDGLGSLRQAVLTANSTPGADSITFDPLVFGVPRTIALKTRIPVTDALSVVGAGADKTTISGNFLDNCFELKAGNVPISFSDLAITRGYGATSGIVSFGANLTITNCLFAEHFGGYGAIAATGGTVSISGTTFRDNRASLNGGAIYTISPTTIDNCTFIDNSAGGYAGALYAIGVPVSITNSRFLDNRALGTHGGAIFAESAASITLTRTNVQGNFAKGSGGGIYLDDTTTLKLQESAIVENTALADGGGIFMRRWTDAPDDVLSLRNVTMAGNSAGGFGGAIRITETTATGTHALRVRHATIANNTAGSGGGGLSLAANAAIAVELESSILAGNVHPTTPDAQSPTGLKLTNSALGSSVGVGTVTGTGALVNLDVKLSPLAFNGGITPTMFPRPDSPVRTAGSLAAGVSYDQRGPGFPRLLGVNVDMGAVETEQATPQAHASFVDILAPTTAFTEFNVTFRDDNGIVVSTIATGDIAVVGPNGFTVAVPTLISLNDLSDGTPRIATFSFAPPGGAWDSSDNGLYTVVLKAGSVYDTSEYSPLTLGPLGTFEVAITGQYVVTNANDAGPGSLRNALALANAYPGTPDTITFDPVFFATERVISLDSGSLLVGDGVTIVGPGAQLLTIDGQSTTRIVYADSFNASDEVSISGIRFVNGLSADPYEPISGQARGGSAIFAADGDLDVSNCQFFENSSFGPGGAIGMGVGSGFLTLTGSTFVGNSAYGKTNINTPFDDTYYHGRGGAVGGNGTGATIDACNFALNTALVSGGAVMLAGHVTVTNSSFHSNSTLPANKGAWGGAVATQFGSLTLANTTLTQNTAGRGGAVFASTAPLTITACLLDGNTATAFEGGGAVSGLASKMNIDLSAITNNSTGFRGAGIAVDAGSLLVTNTSITTNTSGYSGGGIYVIGAITPDGINLRNVTLGHNRGAHNGGGLFVVSPQATVNIDNSTIVWNTGNPAFLAQAGGGGICVIDGASTVTLRSTIVSSNIGKFGPDIFANSASVLIHHSAVGNTSDIANLIDLGSNQIGADLKLGPAGSNGGIGQTYLPGPGSPLIDTGINPLALPTDQRGAYYFRTQGPATDIGAVEVQRPTTVVGVEINDGDAQRSMVRSLTVTFSRPVTFIGGPSAAFLLNHANGTTVGLDIQPVDGDPTSYRMRFNGPSTHANSLMDGRYNLRVNAGTVTSFGTALDGNGDEVTGDDYVMVGDPATNGLFRLFGDADGDGTVSSSDFMAFRLAFLGTKSDFDHEGDGTVDAGDFIQFRLRFLLSV